MCKLLVPLLCYDSCLASQIAGFTSGGHLCLPPVLRKSLAALHQLCLLMGLPIRTSVASAHIMSLFSFQSPLRPPALNFEANMTLLRVHKNSCYIPASRFSQCRQCG